MSDKLYRQFIQRQRSCLSGTFSEWLPDIGGWRNPACHVRRAADCGTAFKADHSCVPLTHWEHGLQGTKGELQAIVLCGTLDVIDEMRALCAVPWTEATHDQHVRAAKDWFEVQEAKYFKLWQEYSGQVPKLRK